MKIWKLELWGNASCGEHDEVKETWLFTTEEKAKAKRLDFIDELSENLIIEEVEVF